MPSPRKKTPADPAAPKKPAARRKPAAKKPATSVEPAAARRARTVPPAADGDAAVPTAGRGGFDLLVVESPAKAKTINKYLGSRFKVLASYGHVRDLATGRRQGGEEVSGIRIGDGWKLRYLVDAGAKKNAKRKGRRTQQDILDELKSAANKAGRVFLASDPDREGEAISWHIADELQLDPATTFRVRFNEITKTAIQAAMASPDRIDMDRVKAQEARRAMDRVVGFPLSGLLGEKLARGLSAGRVQSPAVKLIVDREREIEAFRTEEYWELTALLAPQGAGVRWAADPKKSKILAKKKPGEDKPTAAKKPPDADGDAPADDDKPEKSGIPDAPAGTFTAKLARFNGAEVVVPNEAEADRLTAALTGVPYVVSKIEQKDQQQRPRPPYTTSTLQQEANVRLRFAASRTMQTAQRLYEGVDLGGEGTVALITYMRTDSTRIGPDALKAVRDYIPGAFGDRYLPAKANLYASGKSAQEAHECVRPTDVAMTPERAARAGLAGDQLRLYTLIWQRFVASQMTPAVFAVTSVEVTAGPGLFRASGRIERFDGFRRVLPTKAEDVELPPLAERQPLDRLDLFETQHFTQPPPRYNEGSLVKVLEKAGIGRPRTYASIIETIQARGYVRQENRRFFATDVGKTVTDLLVRWFPKIIDLGFTSHFEQELDEIETGKSGYEQVLDEFYGPFSKDLAHAQTAMPVQKGIETGEKCPECGRPLIVLFSQKTGKQFVGCSGYKEDPACKYIKPGEGEEARPQPVMTDIDCVLCKERKMVRRVGKNGPFLSCSGYPDCRGTMNLDAEGNPVYPKAPTDIKCEKCGSPMLQREGKRGPFLGCTGYPKCKNIVDLDADGKVVRAVDPGVACDKCNSPMTVKKGPRGPFLACTAYPKCRNAKPLSAELKEKLKDVLPAAAPAAPKAKMPEVEIPDQCPECSGPMKLQKSRFGGRYFLGCLKYPKCKGTAKVGPELAAKIAAAEAEANVAPDAAVAPF